VSVQDRCMVCAKCTIGSEIVLDAHDGTPRLSGSYGISFWSVWNCVSVGARYVHGLRRTYHRRRNHFGCTQWDS
jgi:hypothetical protein